VVRFIRFAWDVSNFGEALRIVLADDHRLFREGLRGMLESDGMEVVGEAADGVQAVALARELKPDLVVMDLNMGSSSGLQALARVVDGHLDVRVVVLTVSADPHDVLRALAAGARGYLLKDTPVDQLTTCVRQAAEGQIVLSSDVAGALQSHAHVGVQGAEDSIALTPRETQVLRLIADGADNGAIGRELSISPHTVKRYVKNIFEKLGVRSRVQAAVHATRVGLL
jgi:two-component system nitrate/nitrite response regulator NarL